jgi:serine/threonine protein kinase/Tfp pilus assembly protein PilF
MTPPTMGSEKPEKDRLSDLAAAIADGAEVDWTSVDDRASEAEQQALFEQLRLIELVANVHRHEQSAHPIDDRQDADSPAPDVESTQLAARNLGHWGEFILIEEVGRGSFGTVYRAHDPRLDRPAAVKLLRPSVATDQQLAALLLHEGQTLARVEHDNVVKVYGAGDHGGRVGLAMEFIRGLTLEQMLLNHGPFSAGEAGLIGYELCGALAAVHHAGLVHRDVKAQNVMREEGGRLVLMDFGAGQKRSELVGASGSVLGTPLYVAPEVLNGAVATPQSDLYSVGVLMYHLVSNDFPVKAPTFDELMWAHAHQGMRPLLQLRPRLSRTFVRIVERSIDPDPARRFASADQMATALARIQGSGIGRTGVPRLRTSVPTKPAPRVAARRDTRGPSVAVLPFSDMSPAKDQEYFCDGMTEELINALTQIPGLRVAARTSAFQFKGRARDIRQIGNALDVATVLDGSVRKDGNRVRVTVELVGSADGYHLWSERFDRDLIDIFAVQDEIATSVVSTLKGKLAAAKSIAAAPAARNLEAYGFYLEGRYHWNKRTEDELVKSVTCFEKAIERDPAYAHAYTGMADAYVTLGTYGALAAEVVMPQAKRALERALEIDPELADSYTCRGCVRSVYDWSWSDAEHDFRRAIELKPSYPTAHHWYAINHLVPVGRFDEATQALNRALELDPLALAIKTSLGMRFYFGGQYEDAERELSKTIDLDQQFGLAHLFLGATYTELARYEEARNELEAALWLSGRRPEILAALGYLHGRSGNHEGAQQTLRELVSLGERRYVSPAKVAQVHVGLGDAAGALDCLEAAHAERAADLAWLGVRPVFATLRSEPRFISLLKDMAISV